MTTPEILTAFRNLNVLVVGDICLDRWCHYDPDQSLASAETGIPRIAVTHTEVTPGAAGTVAKGLVALGCGGVAMLGVIGDDGHGHELLRCMGPIDITTDLVIRTPDAPTFTYTKLINQKTGVEDLPRVDFIQSKPLPALVEDALIHSLLSFSRHFDLIIVADQSETGQGGVVTPRMRDAIAEIVRERPQQLIWVDSRSRAELFRGVVLKPNRREANEASLRLLGRIDDEAFRAATQAPLLIITEGSRGAVVINDQGRTEVPSRPIAKPVDICGAGDSFTAGASLTLAITGSPVEAARIGNLVASVTVMKPGTGTASPEEVIHAEQQAALQAGA